MARQPGATQEEVRRQNLSMVLRQIHVHGALSRAELTSLMGLNRSTIKALVSDLSNAGLVTEQIPDSRLGVGRPSHVVRPCQPGPHVVAASIGVDAVSVAVVGLGGTVLARRGYRLSDASRAPADFTARLVGEIHRLRTRLPAGGRLVGIGIAVPGIVRRSDGLVELAPNFSWSGVPFGDLVRDAQGTAVPVRIGNDGDLGALAEHLRGAGRGIDNMIYIAGEVGVGGGIIIDGRMAQGHGGYAGELGHMIVNPAGRRCRCGSRGCLETEIGEEAILLACGRPATGGRAALRDVLTAARAGEPGTLAGLQEIGRWLARGLASLISLFNPELIILGGPLAGVLRYVGDTVLGDLDELALPPSRSQVRLAAPGLGDDSSLLGAAELAFECLLRAPVDEAPAGTPPAHTM